jgi:DNA-binding response OmpR family regulator
LHLSLNRAEVDGRHVPLTPRESELLEFFMRHPGETYSRQELLKAVWGQELPDMSTVTVHITRLRKKIEGDPSHPRLLLTVWGVGYCLASLPAV